MTIDTTTYHEPDPELRHRTIPAGDARVAVFTRTYQTTVEDLWDACTDPERLRRWYVPVTGDLRVGGSFQQVNMGSGTIVVCDAPHLLKLSLGGGADGGLVFYGSVKGGARVAFPMVSSGSRDIVFANPSHDYPQRIHYWREGMGLKAEISQMDGSKKYGWTYGRQGGN
jgi:uncharacterized protein YndB with AHSA1/START domain